MAAQANEFKPAWGYASIDEQPFNDPAAGGALLPSTRVFPRGFIKDTIKDGKDVRMTVFVFTPGNAARADRSYSVDEGDFVNADISRRLDISPFEVSYLAYDFCRFNPSNGVVEVCEERYRIGRPSPDGDAHRDAHARHRNPAAGTADADGDGVPVPADCWDQNATVFPGAKEVPGNAIDDDCAGGDAPGRLTATIKNKWTKAHGRLRLDELRVLDAPEGALVEVTCRGARCPFKRRVDVGQREGQRPAPEVLQAPRCGRRSRSTSGSRTRTGSGASDASASSASKSRTCSGSACRPGRRSRSAADLDRAEEARAALAGEHVRRRADRVEVRAERVEHEDLERRARRGVDVERVRRADAHARARPVDEHLGGAAHLAEVEPRRWRARSRRR